MNKSKHEETEIKSIENHIQNLLNLLIKGLQSLNTKDTVFKSFEEMFFNSDSLVEYLSGLHIMLETLINSMQKKISSNCNESGLNVPLYKTKKNGSNENSDNLANSNYANLEKLVQKYEAEIREHIRIEQQLKIYSDGLEEKMNAKERDLQVKINKLQGKLVLLKRENNQIKMVKRSEARIGTSKKRKQSQHKKGEGNTQHRSLRKVNY
jgi:hypothetical protein